MYILALSVLCSATAATPVPELTYNEEIKGENIQTEWFSKEADSLMTLEGISSATNFKLICDPDYIFNHVTYLSNKKDISEQYECTREGNKLLVRRLSGEKECIKEYNIGRCPWIQEFNFGMRPFVLSGLGSFKFCIVNPADLSLNKMVAKKQRVELLKVGEKTYRAQKIKITLQGPKALFWTAYAWYDTTSGHMVMYKGNKGPNTPTSVVTLQPETKATTS